MLLKLRHSGSYPTGTEIDLNNPTDWLLPSLHAHVDQTPGAVLGRIRLQLPDEADFLLQGRVRVITSVFGDLPPQPWLT